MKRLSKCLLLILAVGIFALAFKAPDHVYAAQPGQVGNSCVCPAFYDAQGNSIAGCCSVVPSEDGSNLLVRGVEVGAVATVIAAGVIIISKKRRKKSAAVPPKQQQ